MSTLDSILFTFKKKYPTLIHLAAQEISYLPKEIDPAGIIKINGGVASVMATKFERLMK